MRIGVLALQGAFREHLRILSELGAEAVGVRLPADLEALDGLVIPGGESTTMGKLATQYGLIRPLRDFARRKPTWGTCAGMILMAKTCGRDQPLLEVMDIAVERNAFGRQVQSFEIRITVRDLEEGSKRPFPAVFIRAPRLARTWGTARVMARLPDGAAVAAVQGRRLVTAFHPELTADRRFHRFFLELAGT